MTNELTTDAEESGTIEKTAMNQSEPTTATAETAASQPEETPTAEIAAAPEPQAAAAAVETLDEPVLELPDEQPAAAEPPAEPSPALIAEAAVPPPPSAPEPAPAASMAEETPADDGSASTDIDFGAILEQFEQEQTVYHSGELVTGTVVGITDRGVLVDFGYKSEGFVPVEELTGPDGEITVKVGETIEVVIRSIHSGDSAPQLSRTDALGRKVWDEIETAFNSETPVVGRILDKTKGGLRVDLNGIEAFLPGSQIDSRPIRA